VQQLRAGGDELRERDAFERPAVVGDQLDPMRLAGVRVDGQQLGQWRPAEAFGLGDSDPDGFDRVGACAGRRDMPACSHFVK
jgi:hypothetical protein